MPGRNMTGPRVGPESGGRGRMTGGGPGGPKTCVCPGCGYTQPHTRGTPCMQVKCPKCGMNMVRGE